MYNRILKPFLIFTATVFLVTGIPVLTLADSPGSDVIDWYRVNAADTTIEFDTGLGPYYRISYSAGVILDCTSDGAMIRSCVLNGDQLTLTLYSDELPQDTIYTFDLSVSDFDPGDVIDLLEIDTGSSIITFDTAHGPRFVIDYSAEKILDCTSEGAILRTCVLNGNILTIIVFSDELPQDSEYVFDLTKRTVVTPTPATTPIPPAVDPTPTAGPLPTVTTMPTVTTTPTPAPLLTVTPMPTVTPTPTPAPLPTVTPMPTVTPTAAPVPTVTPSPTVTPMPVVTITPRPDPQNGTWSVGDFVYTVKNGNATVKAPNNKKAKKLTIPATIKIGKYKIPVTGIGSNAFKNMKKLTAVTIGKNISSIGKQAFLNCSSLSTITIRTVNLTSRSIKSGAFKGISGKAVVKCPSGRKKAYKEILLKKGMKKTVTFV